MDVEDALVDLAAVVADGSSPDWESTESGTCGADDREAVRELRIIAEIANVYRRAQSGDGSIALARSDSSAQSAAATPYIPKDAPRWGSLIILDKLGAGAFGDVFRAWDTALRREVALKLMRRRTTRSADAIVHEGQLLARVHHANVMSIYGARVIGGQVGIWGELLSGRTLAQMVAENGPLSADEALVFADAICRALAAAHRAGLLHQDVKAQNVIREKGGRIVLMDFGLGRELADITGQAGSKLAGTPLYMAPELFAGDRASVQSDIYSVGVLMFFLVSGTFPVFGKGIEEIAARHAAGDRRRLEDLRPDLPTSFVQVVERALDPDLHRRFESAGALQNAVSTAAHPAATHSDRTPSWFRRLANPAVVAVVVATVIATALATYWWTRPAGGGGSQVTFRLQPPAGSHFSDTTRNVAAVSPNGEHVALVATDANGDTQLWLHSLRTMSTVPVPESRRAIHPFWSPDSTSIAFFGEEGLKRITVGGVRADTVTAAVEPRGGTWSPRGVILFADGPRGGLLRVQTSGAAKPEIVMRPDQARGELAYQWPQFLPDGERFIYFVLSNDDRVRGIYLGSLDGRTRTRLVASDASGIVASSALLFVRDGNLAAQRFDASRGAVTGDASVVARRVAASFDHRSAVSASGEGTLVYSPAEQTRLTWYGRDGRRTGAIDVPGQRFRSPALSADNEYLAVQRYRDSLSEIAIFDLVRGGTLSILTRSILSTPQTPAVEFPVWAPGPEHRLAYASSDRGWHDLYVKTIGSSEPPTLLVQSDSDKMPTDWSPDGRYLTYTDLPGDGSNYHLWVVEAIPGAKPFMFSNGQLDDGWARFSPDGKRLAYVSTDSGRAEIWIRAFPDGKTSTKISTAGGVDPMWLSNSELSFLEPSGTLRLARIQPEDHRLVESPASLFATRVVTPGASRNNYAWSADRQRILIVEPVADRSDVPVIVMANWNAARRDSSF